MQWSCPHCGVHLAVSDETLGTGWSFSRCYKCGGFALIRRAEINIIKVDKAPPGERIILPEASHALMSENATRKIAKHIPSQTKTDSLPPPILQSKNGAPTVSRAEVMGMQIQSLPDPLPELSLSTVKFNKIPIGMSVTAVMAVVSGVYLYIQGQALWNRAHEPTAHRFETHAESQIESKAEQTSVPKPEGKTNIQTSKFLSQDPPSQIIIDQLHRSAMAPVKIDPTEAEPHSPVVKARQMKAE